MFVNQSGSLRLWFVEALDLSQLADPVALHRQNPQIDRENLMVHVFCCECFLRSRTDRAAANSVLGRVSFG